MIVNRTTDDNKLMRKKNNRNGFNVIHASNTKIVPANLVNGKIESVNRVKHSYTKRHKETKKYIQ